MFSGFMQNTWAVSTLVAITAGLVGFFVVLRGTTFAAHALPLGIFPGAAAASLLGIDQIFGLFGFAVLGVAGISWLSRQQRNDVATALTLIALLGLGTLFLSLSRQYSQSVYALLFGEVLGVSRQAVAAVALASCGIVAAILLSFRPLLLSAVSRDLGATRGISAAGLEILFLTVLAISTAIALPVVGALLVFSLMVGPASVARAFSARPLVAMCLSVAIAVAIAWASIALSYACNWPVGFFVGSLAALAYAVGRLRIRSARAQTGRRALNAP